MDRNALRRKQGGQAMTTLFVLLSTIIYLLAKVNTHDDLTQTTKDKGHDALTSQPLDD